MHGISQEDAKEFAGTSQGLRRDFAGTLQGLYRECAGTLEGFSGTVQGIRKGLKCANAAKLTVPHYDEVASAACRLRLEPLFYPAG